MSTSNTSGAGSAGASGWLKGEPRLAIEAVAATPASGATASPSAAAEAVVGILAEHFFEVADSGDEVDLTVKESGGQVRIAGSVNSVDLHHQLRDQIAAIKAIEGIKSVDLSGVAVNYPKP